MPFSPCKAKIHQQLGTLVAKPSLAERGSEEREKKKEEEKKERERATNAYLSKPNGAHAIRELAIYKTRFIVVKTWWWRFQVAGNPIQHPLEYRRGKYLLNKPRVIKE